MDNAVVLDSFALIAHFEGDDHAAKVTSMLRKAQSGAFTIYMSAINFGEVYYITMRERGNEKAEEIFILTEQLPIKIVNPDMDTTISAAKLKAKYPVAYADCFAAATALRLEATLLTGDPEFKKLASMVPIEWL